MKIIVAGSRHIHQGLAHSEIVKWFRNPPISLPTPLVIVSGGARGVDTAAKWAAKELEINFVEFPADWNRFGKSAGYKRNAQMEEYSDALLLIWDGQSKGSAMMKSLMQKSNKPIWEIIVT